MSPRSRRLSRWAFALGALLGAAACTFPGSHWHPRSARSAAPAAPDPAALLARTLGRASDRSRIVYAAAVNGTAQIFSIQPDGRRSIQLTLDPRYKCRPVWSIDHRRIAYFRYPGDRPAGEFVDLAVMDANGDNARDVVLHLKVDVAETRPAWSLDDTILYVQEKDFPSVLFGYAAASGRQVDTVRLPKTTFLDRANTLSLDSQWIAGSGPARGSGLRHSGIVRRKDGRELDLMRPFTKLPVHVGLVVWSYDSRCVAFELDDLILVMPCQPGPTARPAPLTSPEASGSLQDPAFSPSGRYLACILSLSKETAAGSGDREVSSDLWVMRSDGRQPRRLTSSGACFDPEW